MKKTVSLLLILTLLLCCATALAASANGQGDMVARNAELAAFLDGSGNIYVSGLDSPVNETPADSLLSIDPYRILFLASAGGEIPEGRIVELKLDGFAETIVTDDAYAACLDAESVYYISRTNRNELMRKSLDGGQSEVVFTSNESLERIYASLNGVVVTQVEGAGAYILDAASGQFVSFAGNVASEIAAFDGFEVYLTDGRNLYVSRSGEIEDTLVDSSVQAWAVIGRTVYYLSGSGQSLSLKSYDTTNALWQSVLTLSANMQAQLTASQSSLFMLSNDNVVYSVDVANRNLVSFATLPSPQSYAMTGGRSIAGYRIEAVSGQLNVYGEIDDANALPTFTFVDFTSEIVMDNSGGYALLSAYAIDGESTVWDLLQPAPQYSTLRRGSRGDAVSAIQQPLYDRGYYNYYIDGIYGWRTERAVKLLQADLGLSVTGVADEALQRIILAGDFDTYDPYRALSRGDRGLRVTEMQQRLRDYGYLADDADGIFGPRTQAAVELFQDENGLSVTGVANAETLRALYSSSVKSCSSYIDLRRGDSGYRVRELNRRLKELYYLEGDVGSSYGSATEAAVIRFQQEVGLSQTGRATPAVQRELFSRSAPEYSGYITLRRGDENARVKDLERRLKELGYFDGTPNNYYDKNTANAVKAFQRRVGLEADGVADPETLARLYASDAPAYDEPEKIGAPVIELNAYNRYENGIYHITDNDTIDGGITASWYAEGDVASYDVRIVDDRNTVYADSKNVLMTVASIPLTSLDPDRTYTITVVAHPADAQNDQDTSASIRFMRVVEEPEPEPGEIGKIGKLIVTPEGDDIVRESGVYLIPGETLSFKWSADGSVAGYIYAVRDANGNSISSGDQIDSNLLGVDLSASLFAEGETYTLTVYAVPTNGSINDATVETISFRRKVEADPTPEPTLEPTVPATPEATLTPTEAPAETPTEAPAETPTEAPAETPTEAPAETPTEAPAETPTEAPAETPTEAPAETPTVAPVTGTPVLSASPSAGTTEAQIALSDGSSVTVSVVLVGEGEIQLAWPAEGDVSGYSVVITDSSGNEMVNQNLTNPGATVNSANLAPGTIYSMNVTAHFNGTEATANATLYFMRPAAQQEATEAPSEQAQEAPQAEVEAEAATEPQTETPAETPTEAPTEAPTETPVTGTPVLSASPSAGATEAQIAQADGSSASVSVVLVGEGEIQLAWPAEGDVAGYSVLITDQSGNVMVNQNLANPGATVNSANLAPGTIYSMNVTAHFNGTETTTSATLYFMRPAEVEPAAEPEAQAEAEAAIEPEAQTATEPEAQAEAEPAAEPEAQSEEIESVPMTEPTEEPTPEPTEEPTPEPTEEPTPEPTPTPTPEPTEEPTPEPTEAPTPEPAPEATYPMDDPGAWTSEIGASSDSAAIEVIQKRLVEWKWLADGSYSVGSLDDATVQAVASFQTYCNESGMSVVAIDPSNPLIGVDTLRLLFNADGVQIVNPNA